MVRIKKNIDKTKKCWDTFIEHIVLQAVEDYRKLLTMPEGASYKGDTLESLEAFFKSEYFKLFTKVDGSYLIYKLRKEQKK